MGMGAPECGKPGGTLALVDVLGSGATLGNLATQEWQPGAETQKKCLALAACRASAPRIPTPPGWNQGGDGPREARRRVRRRMVIEARLVSRSRAQDFDHGEILA